MGRNGRWFSRSHKTFDDWDRQAGDSAYANRIRRLHAQYPKRTLEALNKSVLGKVPLAKRNWNALTGRQQVHRERALEVKRKVLQGQDLITAADASNIDLELAVRYLGDFIRIKSDGSVTIKKKDGISRGLIVYTDGQVVPIVVSDSEQASIIGEYFNAVQIYLNTGDESVLLPFEGVAVVDENGEEYVLETDPEEIKAIEEATEEPEFRKIYTGGS